jgi:hypothetical protein
MHNPAGTFVPLFFFLFLAAVTVVPMWLRSRERVALMETARKALERGETLPPELLEALKPEDRVPSAERDLRKGAALVAIALALIVLSLMISLEDRDIVYPLMGAAAFPGFIGLVRLAFWAANRSKPSA